jgi:poly(3-hydroxyoctanoate) depolymerase
MTTTWSRRRAGLIAVLFALVTGLAAVATSAPAGAAASRCSTSGSWVTCERRTTTIWVGIEPRQVHHQTPLGTPPPGGWPTVIMFQGSLFTAELNWSAATWFPFGAYHQAKVLQQLLDRGYAVITPEAHIGGATFWDTNNPLYARNWQAAPDHRLMLDIFNRIDTGAFGPLNGQKLYATGISSGGYMTSRVALEYPSRFEAVAVQSGSYMTCAGPLCVVPSTLPASHPPTLFLHGVLDPVVPVLTMRAYDASLRRSGIPTRVVTETFATHEWIKAAPTEVPAWFDRYR